MKRIYNAHVTQNDFIDDLVNFYGFFRDHKSQIYILFGITRRDILPTGMKLYYME